jgi:hypothetical protein
MAMKVRLPVPVSPGPRSLATATGAMRCTGR